MVGVEGGEGGAPVITSTMLVWRLVGHGSRRAALAGPYNLYDGQRGRHNILDICKYNCSLFTKGSNGYCQ